MNPFEMKDIGEVNRRPSLDSVINHKRRMEAMKKEQQGHLEGIANSESIFNENETYTETEAKLMADVKAMSLVEHLDDLRGHLIWSLVSVLIGCIVSYYYADYILYIITAPAGKLYYMRPTEAFITYLKVSFVSGIVISSPCWLFQIWRFVVPALTKGEKKITILVLPIGILLFLIGVLFSYFLVLPAAIQFFIGFGTEGLQPLFSIGQYIDFVIAFIIPFGIIFELPLLLVALGAVGIISSHHLGKYRKLFVFLAFVIGAAISPTPDMFSQTMIALPMIILYEMSYRIIRHIMKK